MPEHPDLLAQLGRDLERAHEASAILKELAIGLYAVPPDEGETLRFTLNDPQDMWRRMIAWHSGQAIGGVRL
jgi:hypothetical protein